MEVVLSGIVLVALLLSIVPLVELMPGLLTDAESIEVHTFLERALDIVIGIEFIKMLAKHSPGSVLEVLLYAIARHMIVGHEDAVQNLVSVGAIALIFHHPQIFLCAVLRPEAARRRDRTGYEKGTRGMPGSRCLTPPRCGHRIPGLERTGKRCGKCPRADWKPAPTV